MARGPRTPEEDAALRQLGARVAQLRAERNLSQERLADLAEIDRTHIGSYEHGEIDMSLLKVWQLAKGLQVDPSELLRGIRT